MKKYHYLIALTLFFTSFSFAQEIKRIDGSFVSSDSVDLRVQKLMKAANVTGVALAIFNNNEPVYSKTHGLADAEKNIPFEKNSVMYAASFSKTVFAYIAMQLIQEKVIELDKPLVEYLDKPLVDYKIIGWNRGYHDLVNDDRYKKITARMCLTHTTGFPNWRWFEVDKKLKFSFSPGTRYNYSGEGLYLLQFVIEQITGKDFETLAQERVFKPLGMINTSYVWQNRFNTNICYGHTEYGVTYDVMKWKEPSVSGSMSTTLEDYTKFFAALCSAKNLSKESFEAMTSLQVRIRSKAQFGPQSRIDNKDNDGIMLGYGLGVGVFSSPYGKAFFKEGHDEGWGHYSICFPEQKIAVVIMTNNDNGESIFKELLEYTIGDKYTPWRWENYIPYNMK